MSENAAAPSLTFQLLDVTKAVFDDAPHLILIGRTSLEDGDESVSIFVRNLFPYVYVPANPAAPHASPENAINNALIKWRVDRDAEGNVVDGQVRFSPGSVRANAHEQGVVKQCELVTRFVPHLESAC